MDLETRQPRVGTGCIVYHPNQDKILLMKRGPACKRGRHQWSIPCGALEFGERIRDGANRELEEEVGIKFVEITYTMGWVEHFSEGEHWITFLVTGIFDGTPKIMEPSKCTALEWVRYDMFHTYDLFMMFDNCLSKYEDALPGLRPLR